MVSARWGRHAIRPRSWARDMIATTGKPRSIKDLHRAVKVVAENRPYRLVHERDLPTYAGLKRTQIAELIKRGEFPRSIRLSDGGRASIPTHAG
jgi:predicted DNA-binding transcriptional regulator AlpA